MERKLTAILSADVKGYSRLMGQDDEATVRTLTAHREAMTALIQQHHGRVVDSPGDNLLAEFASVIDAVRCAVEVQHALKSRNAELPPERRMEFRIGINSGDVIVEGERLYGDGVNIAARLEGLAEAGGICVSGIVYDQLKSKLALNCEYLGEQAVKNIAEPVRVYRLVLEVPSPPAGEGTGDLPYPVPVRDSAASGLGHGDNRHLHYLAEFIFVNVGGLRQNVKVSSPPRSGASVGAVIGVGGWESQPRGEAAIRSLEMTPSVRDEGLRSKRSLITWVS